MSPTHTPVLALRLWGHGGVGIARSLGRLGVPIHAVQADPRLPVAQSRYLAEVLEWDLEHAPNADSVEFLLRAARRIAGPPVLVPCDEPAAVFVARNADALHEAFTLPRQPPGLVETLYSKRGLHELCLEHGVPTPGASFPQTREEGHAAIERATFPVVLKPIDNMRFHERTGLRMVIVDGAEEAHEAYDRVEDFEAPNLMIQDYIPGGSESVWVFTGYFDSDSELVFGAGGTKLRQCPIRTGSTCYGDVRSNATMEEVTRRFVKALGYWGVFDCGYRYDPRDGRYKLLDVNPRIGSNFRQCVGAAGTDVVRAMYLDLVGHPVPPDEPDEGRVWWVENRDIVAAIQARLDGGASLRRWARSLRRVDETAWFARDDLAPFRAMCTNPIRHRARTLLARDGDRPT